MLENEAKKVEMKFWGSKSFDVAPRSLAERLTHTHQIELLRKSVKGIGLRNKTILNVAGGRGKEAEFLIRKGCNTLVLGDIAKGQLLGAKSRKEKKGLDNMELILLDAEHLPFRLKTFDLGYIYMGLHHFPNPYRAIFGLCEVSRGTVIFIEIMNPLITKILGSFGLFKKEGCGIEPNRLEEKKVKSTLNQRQMRVGISYFFIPPFYGRSDALCAAMEQLGSTVNFIMRLTRQRLGQLFGNVAVIRGKTSDGLNFEED